MSEDDTVALTVQVVAGSTVNMAQIEVLSAHFAQLAGPSARGMHICMHATSLGTGAGSDGGKFDGEIWATIKAMCAKIAATWGTLFVDNAAQAISTGANAGCVRTRGRREW